MVEEIASDFTISRKVILNSELRYLYPTEAFQLVEQSGMTIYEAWGSFGNFVLIEFDTKKVADKVTEGLGDSNIIVRGNLSGLLEKSIMVTCGPIASMRRVSKLIKEITGKG